MKTIVAAVVAMVAACAHGPSRPPEQALADWHGKFPLAAQELCLSEQANPVVARRLLQWERDNPVVAQDLLEWAATHPGEPLPAFLRDHPSFQADAWFWGNSGVGLLLDWAQRHPEAALALSDDPDLLSWSAAHHAC
jgi:hypothetical protein